MSNDPELLRAFVFGKGYVQIGNDQYDSENPREDLGMSWEQDEQLIKQNGQCIYIKGN